MKPESMDAVFQALAHRMRRRILDILKQSPGASVNEVCDHFDVSRIAILKHLNLLEAAGLIVSKKSGRVRQLYFNAMPIQLIYDRWTTEYSAFWAGQVADWKHMIEAEETGLAEVSAEGGDSVETANESATSKPPAESEAEPKKKRAGSKQRSTSDKKTAAKTAANKTAANKTAANKTAKKNSN